MIIHLQINDAAPCVHYESDGVQAAFTFPFALFKAADLEVWLDNVRVLSGFTVSGVGISSGGVVLFAVPPATGSRVTLRRRMALERLSDFQTDGIIRAKTLNDELDYQVAAVQQVADDVSRCVRRPFTSSSTADLTLPEPVAGRTVKWADDGQSLVNTVNDVDQVVATATALANAAAASRAAADADAAATAADRLAVAADKATVVASTATVMTDAAAAHADRLAVAADKATVVASTATVVADAAQVAADRQVVSAAVAATAANAMATAADRVAVVADAVAAHADRCAADASASAAAASATLAAGYAATLNLPGAAGHALDYIRQRADGSGFEYRTPVQVLADIGGQSATAVLDQVALTNLRLMLNTSVSSGALAQGYQWELATDEWAGRTTNATYAAGSPGYYTNETAGVGAWISTGTPTMPLGGTAASINDNNPATVATTGALGNLTGATAAARMIARIDYGSLTTITQVKAVGYCDQGAGTNPGHQLYYSTDNTTWIPYGSSFTTNQTPQDFIQTQTVSARYIGLAAAATAWGSLTAKLGDLLGFGPPAPTNMSLLSPVVPVSSAPSVMVCYFLLKDIGGGVVVGTDITCRLSRNGGVTKTAAVMTIDADYGDGYKRIKARADVSGQPSGTSMLADIGTLNNKAQRVAAPSLHKE